MSTTINTPEYFWKCCIEGNTEQAYDIVTNGICTDVNLGLTGACRSHQQDVVDTMVELGAQYCGNCDKSMKEHMTH
jgi:hypothetical protein